ncbi:Adenosylcobinamide-GDP ribazoletransferase [Beijerinckiaceae bacterium RH AL1]|nr:Adenosylcobinamide-GDP ribazoletransferase [Beijerinckiaceae bacterium RH AL8]VVB42929.1 Adenosylcobinamide-GDP ribazoletransferase [Beijerinckiaceae bacterium RH CH11]VVC53573.1 Adenosylcobinamide-GDP ribazoletransferase [Beijerinckiaceae bacterium RH AL1]
MPHLADDLFISLRFFSRLPVPATARERALGTAGLANAAALVPVAGAIIGLLPALVLLAASALGLPPVLAAPLAIATLALVTGALHEDALSDCADGFGGGRTRERKLEIMRDSRIGAFGGVALALSLYIRVTALAVITEHAAGTAALVLVAAAALSRAASLWPLAWLPPARADGIGAAAEPAPAMAGAAAGLALVLALALLAPAVGLARALCACVFAVLVTAAFCELARKQIQGHTGDVAGATQQLAEIAVYLTLAASP